MRRVLLALMGAAAHAWHEAGGDGNPQNPADPYMTTLAYFNSLRELGDARRIMEEEVSTTITRYGARRRIGEARRLFRDRTTFSEVLELTSRVSTDKVAAARRRLECPFNEVAGRPSSCAGCRSGRNAKASPRPRSRSPKRRRLCTASRRCTAGSLNASRPQTPEVVPVVWTIRGLR